jgi:Ecdysteroid kinase-like family
VITDIQQVTPMWLTEILRTNGFSPSVVAIDTAKFQNTNNSMVYHLLLSYEDGHTNAPTRLFLKIPNAETLWPEHEIRFYSEIAPIMGSKYDNLPFVRCFDVAYDVQTHRSHFLMEDLSDTHFDVTGGEVPTHQYHEQVVDGFALLHAFWWEHPRLGVDISQRLTSVMIGESVQRAQVKFSELQSLGKVNFSCEQYCLLAKVAAKWPERRKERVVNGQGVTLVHRDPHPLNFLYSYGDGKAKIIDWQSWRVDTGTDDLAYMMACHWDAEQRAQMEMDLIKRYYHRLTEFGVKNYTWDDCLYDYRASIIRCLFFLMIAWSPAQSTIWQQRVERGLQAFQDYNCAELLK